MRRHSVRLMMSPFASTSLTLYLCTLSNAEPRPSSLPRHPNRTCNLGLYHTGLRWIECEDVNVPACFICVGTEVLHVKQRQQNGPNNREYRSCFLVGAKFVNCPSMQCHHGAIDPTHVWATHSYMGSSEYGRWDEWWWYHRRKLWRSFGCFPVFDSLTGLCPSQQFMYLWWQRAACHCFPSSLAVKTLAATFMDSLTKPRNNQWKQLPLQGPRRLPRLLSVRYYSASAASVLHLFVDIIFCAVLSISGHLFRNMVAGRRGRRASVCRYGCSGAGRMEEMTVSLITTCGLTGVRHCIWDYLVWLNRCFTGKNGDFFSCFWAGRWETEIVCSLNASPSLPRCCHSTGCRLHPTRPPRNNISRCKLTSLGFHLRKTWTPLSSVIFSLLLDIQQHETKNILPYYIMFFSTGKQAKVSCRC